jgi:ribosomal protein S18 acetylase RimI-like enzyme
VAERGGRVVAFAVVVDGPGAVRELDGLFVEPGVMRTGAGRALVDDLTAALDDDTGLEVTANVNALGFYERVGFEACGTVDTRFGPAVRMRWHGR